MDQLIGLADRGLGFTLFVISALANIYQFKSNKNEVKEKDLQIKELNALLLTKSASYTESFTEVAKEMVGANKDSVNATALLQQSINSITQILQQLTNSVSGRK